MPSPTPDQVKSFQSIGRGLLGTPYKLGAKWELDHEPEGPIDCSGLAKWMVHRILGVVLPDGSYNQIKVCERLPDDQQDAPPILSLGFYAPNGVDVDHVNIVFDNEFVIEARGDPQYNKVVLRPIVNWRHQRGFLGFHAIQEIG